MAISDKQRQAVLPYLEQGLSLRKAAAKADISRPEDVLDCANPDKPQYIAGYDAQYAQARERGYSARADSIMDTAWDMSIDPAHKRLILDAQKWELSKMLPKVYADRTDVNLTGKLEHAHAGAVSSSTEGILAAIAGKGTVTCVPPPGKD